MKKVLLVLFILIMMFAFAGCINYEAMDSDSTATAAKQNEAAVADLIKQDTLPNITKSLDRANIKRRVEFMNQPDRIGYLYLMADNGTLIAEIQVLGKATSLNSYMTPMEEVTAGRVPGYGKEIYVAEAPDVDGTWGQRPEGIFWFDANGVYQEWNGLYLYSAERRTYYVEPILIEVLQ